MLSVLAIDFQSQTYSLTENHWLNSVLGCIPFVSFCRFYESAGVLEDCARGNDFFLRENVFHSCVDKGSYFLKCDAV